MATKTQDNPMSSKYSHLSANFFRGSMSGQLSSVYRDRESKPEKLQDFKKALKDGDLKLTGEITSQQANKLKELGIKLPDGVTVKQAQRQASQKAA